MREPAGSSGNPPPHSPGPFRVTKGEPRFENRALRTYLFESGTHVLWAEEVAKEREIPVEVVPAPSGFSDLCALAIRAFADAAPALETLLEEEGISFRVLP